MSPTNPTNPQADWLHRRLRDVVRGLRDPLTTVVGATALLDSSWDDLAEAQRKQLVELVHAHSRRIGTALEELHALVQVDPDRSELVGEAPPP